MERDNWPCSDSETLGLLGHRPQCPESHRRRLRARKLRHEDRSRGRRLPIRRTISTESPPRLGRTIQGASLDTPQGLRGALSRGSRAAAPIAHQALRTRYRAENILSRNSAPRSRLIGQGASTRARTVALGGGPSERRRPLVRHPGRTHAQHLRGGRCALQRVTCADPMP